MPTQYLPWTLRTVGVEMEITTSKREGGSISAPEIAHALRGMSLPVGSSVGTYYHSDGRTWDVKSDSSCGYEIASPAILLDESMHNADLKKVCDYLIGPADARVTQSCGLHVHVDCGDFSWKELRGLMALWARYEPFFWDMQPASRKSNHYCRPYGRIDWTEAPGANNGAYNWSRVKEAIEARSQGGFREEASGLERTMALNVSGWWRHGRVEFRLGAGTVDYGKIRHWAALLAGLCSRAKNSGVGQLFGSIPATRVEGGSSLRTTHLLAQLGMRSTGHNVDRIEAHPAHDALKTWCDARRARYATTPVARRVRPANVAAAVARLLGVPDVAPATGFLSITGAEVTTYQRAEA